MANRYAVATGNWSNVATWDGGTTLPGVGDVVRPNGFVVTIDQNITVGTLTNTASAPAASGGYFIATNGITINAHITGWANTSGFGVLNWTGSGALIINGDILAGSGSSGLALTVTSGASVTLNITGNVTGGSGSGSAAIAFGTGCSGTVNIVGNMVGGATSNSFALTTPSLITINVTGNVTGGPGGGVAAISVSAACVCTIVGNCTANAAQAVTSSSASVYNITGTVTASAGMPAVTSLATTGVVNVNGHMVNHSTGTMAVSSYKMFLNKTSPCSWAFVASDSTARTLYTADNIGGNPAEVDVRSGTTYGPASELTGTLAVPPAGSVALGVPVDNTTGTAAITQQAIADAVGPLLAAYGS